MSVTVTVKKTVEHQRRNNFALELIVGRWDRIVELVRNVLVDALMRSLLIEVVSIGRDNSIQLMGVKDEEIVNALAT